MVDTAGLVLLMIVARVSGLLAQGLRTRYYQLVLLSLGRRLCGIEAFVLALLHRCEFGLSLKMALVFNLGAFVSP